MTEKITLEKYLAIKAERAARENPVEEEWNEAENFIYNAVHHNRQVTACSCMCHTKIAKGCIMHCVPCCSMTYERYINEDGTVDQVVLDAAIVKEIQYAKEAADREEAAAILRCVRKHL